MKIHDSPKYSGTFRLRLIMSATSLHHISLDALRPFMPNPLMQASVRMHVKLPVYHNICKT